MTNKEFRKILKNENSTLDWMLKNGTLSFGVIYKATEELHKQVNYSPLIEAGASWSIFATEQVYPGSTGSPFPDK